MRFQAELCYTPMWHAKFFGSDKGYRDRNFKAHPEDRPLFAQFCSNNAQELLQAAKVAEATGAFDAIDINLGCPQACVLLIEFDCISKVNCHFLAMELLVYC